MNLEEHINQGLYVYSKVIKNDTPHYLQKLGTYPEIFDDAFRLYTLHIIQLNKNSNFVYLSININFL